MRYSRHATKHNRQLREARRHDGLEIFQVADCPNAAVLTARISDLAHDRADLQITRQVVTTEEDAERLGMTGSPILLANGADPFARPRQKPSILCRLYRDEHGRPRPAW